MCRGAEEEAWGWRRHLQALLLDSLLPLEGVSCPLQSCMDGTLEEGMGALTAPLASFFGERSRSSNRVAWCPLPTLTLGITEATPGPLSQAAPGGEACGAQGRRHSEGGWAAGRGQGPEKEGLQCQGSRGAQGGGTGSPWGELTLLGPGAPGTHKERGEALQKCVLRAPEVWKDLLVLGLGSSSGKIS